MASTAAWLRQRIEEVAEEHAAHMEQEGPLWTIHLDMPTDYLYGDLDGVVNVGACLMNMRRRFILKPTTQEDLWRLTPCQPMVYSGHTPCPLEHIVCPQCSMKAVMACVRASQLHGLYYKSPETRKERAEWLQERKEYRF